MTEYEFERMTTFESDYTNDYCIRISKRLMNSKAWRALTSRQKILYLVCRAQVNPGLMNGNAPCHDFPDKEEYKDERVFYMTKGIAEKQGIYCKKTFDKKGFYDGLKKLCELGFIEKISAGGFVSRSKSVYRLSGKWAKKGFEEDEHDE